MKRIKDEFGFVHLRGMSNAMPLCGNAQRDLLGQITTMTETSEPANCHQCAALYCRIKNAPWNEVEEKTMDKAIYNAVKEDSDAGTPLQ